MVPMVWMSNYTPLMIMDVIIYVQILVKPIEEKEHSATEYHI